MSNEPDNGAPDNGAPDNGATDNGEPEETLTASVGRWKSDLKLVVGLVFATYLAFGLLGILTGVSVNETAGFLQTVTFFAAVFALLTLALNLHWGYTGLFNIGIAGFMAVGVYTMAILTASPDGTPAGFGLPIPIGVIGGTIAAGLVGAVIALPALRVRADYFAIITLGFSEIVRLTITSGSLRRIEVGERIYGTGGGSGIRYTPVDTVVPWLLDFSVLGYLGEVLYGIGAVVGVSQSIINRVLYALVIITFVLLFYLLLQRIARSPFGRILKAIREDEIVARSLGKDTQRAKIKVFTLGCALMGLAGILWIGSRSLVTPESFMPVVTFYIFVALIVGGAGSNTGSVVGGFVFAAFLWEGPRFVRTILRSSLDVRSPPTIYDAFVELAALDPMPLVGYVVGSLDEIRWVLIGVVLVLLMIYRPEGLMGDRKEIAAATDLSRPGRGGSDE
ncbi:branched-chain amino acid transport system permease protein [Halalkaliarchaeum desulfuricum]|uniref:Branched-chain amino acid transport system permease protein n=1 Tax=Halalkaliarchaeum desulfuricum TaxID=2055893 RepID=A0A343TIG2_9EURY|nr:branched-chain amino acid ABC transporter permease [Halalkaliarchaeum desulfuricum]AUX08884.1 branched-chain amino acid transport system permease protein [Halalkaliarchaeum desulfuricum]